MLTGCVDSVEDAKVGVGNAEVGMSLLTLVCAYSVWNGRKYVGNGCDCCGNCCGWNGCRYFGIGAVANDNGAVAGGCDACSNESPHANVTNEPMNGSGTVPRNSPFHLKV